MDIQDVAFFAVFLLLAAVHALRTVRLVRWRNLRQTARSLAFGLCRTLVCHGKDQLGDELEDAVLEEVVANRVAHFQTFSLTARVLLLVALLHIFSTRLRQGQRLQTIYQDAIVVIYYAQTHLLEMFPGLINARSAGFWYCCGMFLVTLYSLPIPLICKPDYLPQAFVTTTVASWVVSLGYMQPSLVILCNLLSVAVTVGSQQFYPVDHCFMKQIPQKLAITFLICFYSVITERHLRQQARKEVEARLLREKHTACSALLNTFYDVVTELDSNLKILSSGRELSSFLNVKPGQSLDGTKFQELLPVEDECMRFLHTMRRPLKQEESIADVMHVSLLSGKTDSRQVEVFTFKFSSLNGRSRHLVGIRDDADETTGGHLSSPSAHSNRPIVTVSGDVSVSFNSSEPEFPIIACSDAFRQVLGGIELDGCSLKAMIFPVDDFESWTQVVMNRHLVDDPDQPVEPINTFKVWLQPRAAKQACLKATCRAVFSESANSNKSDHSESASQTSDEHFIMRLKFTDLESAPRPGSTTQRRMRGSLTSGPHSNQCSSRSRQSGSSRSYGTPRNVTRRSLPHAALSI